MVRWPGRGGDEGEEGKYSDVARAKPGPKPGTGATEQQVRRILARGGRMRPVEIARRLSEERDGPHVPFEGQHKRTVQHQVSHILRQMEDRGEAAYERRGRRESWWQLTVGGGPRGDPKPTGWTGGHAKAGEGRPENRRPRGGFGVLREPERHEPSNPISAAEQRKKAEARRRRSDPTNPENWGSGRRDLADESERNQEVRERVRRREEERRRSDPTNPENWAVASAGAGTRSPVPAASASSDPRPRPRRATTAVTTTATTVGAWESSRRSERGSAAGRLGTPGRVRGGPPRRGGGTRPGRTLTARSAPLQRPWSCGRKSGRTRGPRS